MVLSLFFYNILLVLMSSFVLVSYGLGYVCLLGLEGGMVLDLDVPIELGIVWLQVQI